MHDPGFADRIHAPAREAPTAAAFPASVPVPASLSVPSLRASFSPSTHRLDSLSARLELH
jgi:hypothetical protein